MNALSNSRLNRQMAGWLIACSAVLLCMILLGGVTRLTQSGLSMVEWKPLMGIIPPLSEQDWQQTFDKYKHFPEYQKINFGMTLPEFKKIFLFEYAHRVLGRFIGVIYLLPLLYFLFRGAVKGRLGLKLWSLFILGGLQGLLGWYMVKSGLVNDPHVSQYRLTIHLGVAVIIYGFMLWTAFGLLYPDSAMRAVNKALPQYAFAITGLLFLMILSGGLVAGTKAGYAYSTFPLMGDSFIPAGLYSTTPAWLAIFEDITTIQFNHRIFAYLLSMLIIGFGLKALRANVTGRIRNGVHCLLFFLLLQVSLGILTILSHVAVPIAASHQGGAMLLLTAALFVCHQLKRTPTTADPVC